MGYSHLVALALLVVAAAPAGAGDVAVDVNDHKRRRCNPCYVRNQTSFDGE